MHRGDDTKVHAGHLVVFIAKMEEQVGGEVLRDRRGLQVDRAALFIGAL